MAAIKVLDCTLRCGMYIKGWSFSNNQLVKVIESTITSHIDFVDRRCLNEKIAAEINIIDLKLKANNIQNLKDFVI